LTTIWLRRDEKQFLFFRVNGRYMPLVISPVLRIRSWPDPDLFSSNPDLEFGTGSKC
jgi:hypothetical protein